MGAWEHGSTEAWEHGEGSMGAREHGEGSMGAREGEHGSKTGADWPGLKSRLFYAHPTGIGPCDGRGA